jgi:hypothetical protein
VRRRARGRIRTDDLSITRRRLSVGYVRRRRIVPAHVGCRVDLVGSRRMQVDPLDDHSDDHGAFDSVSNGSPAGRLAGPPNRCRRAGSESGSWATRRSTLLGLAQRADPRGATLALELAFPAAGPGQVRATTNPIPAAATTSTKRAPVPARCAAMRASGRSRSAGYAESSWQGSGAPWTGVLPGQDTCRLGLKGYPRFLTERRDI